MQRSVHYEANRTVLRVGNLDAAARSGGQSCVAEDGGIMSHTTVYPVSGVPACLADQAEAPPNVAGVSRHSIMNPRIAVKTISISPAALVLPARRPPRRR